MYAKINNGVVEQFPYTVEQLKQDNPQTSFPANITPETLAVYGVVPVVSVGTQFDPATQVATQEGCTYNTAKQRWETAWTVRAKTAEELEADKQALIAQYEQALVNHLDSVAQSKRYDNRISCSVRAGYPGPFQAEGQAFASWMDTCNATAYQWWAQIEAGTKPMFASTDEFIAALPVMVWPA